VLTISAVAEHKKIKLSGINVSISRNTSGASEVETQFLIEINLKGELTKHDKIVLFNSARKCEVGKLLSGKINFQHQLKN
jgi:uncharacterized OsmC-like protein